MRGELALTLYGKHRIIGTPKIEGKRDPQQLAAPARPMRREPDRRQYGTILRP